MNSRKSTSIVKQSRRWAVIRLIALITFSHHGLASAADPWPSLIDLNEGETFDYSTEGSVHQIKLIDCKESTEPDSYIKSNASRKVIVRADVTIEVDGKRAVVVARPFQLPVVVGGLRIGIHTTKPWAGTNYMPIADLEKRVRLEVQDAARPWAPESLRFPIREYRWNSASYYNTWGALVPHNGLYYHRGEDFGAIPDRLPVVAPFSGRILASPRSIGQASDSNRILLSGENGVIAMFSHMNYDSILPDILPGAHVLAGQLLGKTGNTWRGRPRQHSDPHLHFSFHHAPDAVPATVESSWKPPRRLNPYPVMIDAYFRDYPDAAIAVAGGYRYAIVGQEIEHDATRSIARPGEKITSYQWRLHEGTTVEGPQARLTYSKPGLYSEELVVETKSGAKVRDFAQVWVAPAAGPAPGFGRFFHSPVRGIKPGTPVLFWNRIIGGKNPAFIDFGDGTPVREIKGDSEIEHTYIAKGHYIAKLSGKDKKDHPLTLRLEVVVD